MASRIITKKGSGAPLASDLVHGELAVDTVNKRLYTENAGGTIIEVGTSPSTIDINAGTIDGTVIGGSSAAAGTFTSLTATSANVNGTVTADGLSVESATATIAVLQGETGAGNPRLVIKSDADSVVLQNSFSSGSQRDLSIESPFNNRLALFANNGDISFYEDTGTTPKFFWDASAESLGIGTSSPAAKLEIGGAGEGIILASPDGTRYEITVANGGTLTVTAV